MQPLKLCGQIEPELFESIHTVTSFKIGKHGPYQEIPIHKWGYCGSLQKRVHPRVPCHIVSQ
jgi:hypothetical protein